MAQDRILPQHIGIIMDGNGRWAKKRGLPRKAGHKVGAETFRTIATYWPVIKSVQARFRRSHVIAIRLAFGI